jgi:hypothetical protein
MPSVMLLVLAILLTGCGIGPEQAVSVVGGVTVGSIAVMHRTLFDALYSTLTGKDCSVVYLDIGKTYCKPAEPPPEPPPYCTRSLGAVDCWKDPGSLADFPPEVAAGPRDLTPLQEIDRTKRWPPI